MVFCVETNQQEARMWLGFYDKQILACFKPGEWKTTAVILSDIKARWEKEGRMGFMEWLEFGAIGVRQVRTPNHAAVSRSIGYLVRDQRRLQRRKRDRQPGDPDRYEVEYSLTPEGLWRRLPKVNLSPEMPVDFQDGYPS